MENVSQNHAPEEATPPSGRRRKGGEPVVRVPLRRRDRTKKRAVKLEDQRDTSKPKLDTDEFSHLDTEFDALKNLPLEPKKSREESKQGAPTEEIAKISRELRIAVAVPSLERLASADVTELPRHLKEARASLFLAGSGARGASIAERLAAGFIALRKTNPARAEKLMSDIRAFDFETKVGPTEKKVAEISRSLRERPVQKEEKLDEKKLEEIKQKIQERSPRQPESRGVERYEQETEAKSRGAAWLADSLAQEIETKYGAHPEDLMAQAVPGIRGYFASLRFRALNALSHLANQESPYDTYRAARAAEDKGLRVRDGRILHERKSAVNKEEERRQKEQEERLDESRRTKRQEQEQLAAREMAKDVLGQPEAARLYDEVAARMERQHESHPTGYWFSAEDYVITKARYEQAVKENLKGGIKEYRGLLAEMDEEIGDQEVVASEKQLYSDPKNALEHVPQAAALWENLTQAMMEDQGEDGPVTSAISQGATDIILQLALSKKAEKEDNPQAAEYYRHNVLRLAGQQGIADNKRLVEALAMKAVKTKKVPPLRPPLLRDHPRSRG